jgi:hypothetical protein
MSKCPVASSTQFWQKQQLLHSPTPDERNTQSMVAQGSTRPAVCSSCGCWCNHLQGLLTVAIGIGGGDRERKRESKLEKRERGKNEWMVLKVLPPPLPACLPACLDACLLPLYRWLRSAVISRCSALDAVITTAFRFNWNKKVNYNGGQLFRREAMSTFGFDIKVRTSNPTYPK